MSNTFIFDIETQAYPVDELRKVMPQFDPDEVRLGNTKDPVKIADKLAAAKIKHEQSFIEDAALSATTASVLAIGIKDMNGTHYILDGGGKEADLLSEFWTKWATGDHAMRINNLIGFNCFEFDLPFLIRRSWHHGIAVPFGIRKGRYWGEAIVDLMVEWKLGTTRNGNSLDTVAKFLLGGRGKTGSGADFANLWATDRNAAVEYLKADLDLTFDVAKVMGVLNWP